MILILSVIFSAALIVLYVISIVSNESGLLFRLFRALDNFRVESKARRIVKEARRELAARQGRPEDRA